MPFNVKCECGQVLSIPDHLRGKPVKCPGCGATATAGESGPSMTCTCDKIYTLGKSSLRTPVICPSCNKKIDFLAKCSCGQVVKMANKQYFSTISCPKCSVIVDAEYHTVTCKKCGFTSNAGKSQYENPSEPLQCLVCGGGVKVDKREILDTVEALDIPRIAQLRSERKKQADIEESKKAARSAEAEAKKAARSAEAARDDAKAFGIGAYAEKIQYVRNSAGSLASAFKTFVGICYSIGILTLLYGVKMIFETDFAPKDIFVYFLSSALPFFASGFLLHLLGRLATSVLVGLDVVASVLVERVPE